MTEIRIPEFCLILLVGPSGAGKSTFAQAHFTPTEILSSDAIRLIVADDEEALDASADAFAIIAQIAAARLRRRLLTVIDATNLQPDYRKQMVELARSCYAPAVAIVLDVCEKTCLERNALRPLRRFRKVVRRHVKQAQGILKTARREGFARVCRVAEGEEADVSFVRERLWTDARHEQGPFDIIGDVHGCLGELCALIDRLGYLTEQTIDSLGDRCFTISHPEGRRIVFLGDLCDRGPDAAGVLALAMAACASGVALAVKGNHDVKLLRHLRGKVVNMDHGFDLTAAEIAASSEVFRSSVRSYLDGLTSHLLLDGGDLAVAHAGVKEAMQGGAGKLVSDFCTWGEATSGSDAFGRPMRDDWAETYKGRAAVVYGHFATCSAAWVGNTLCLDTGCVYGGSLTALRWPERTLVSVDADKAWCPDTRLLLEAKPPVSDPTRLPDAAALTGQKLIETRFGRAFSIQPGQAAAAFEALSCHGADPRWLVYVPPTTATVEASAREGWLEHPDEAFSHYAGLGISPVCVQEKHMGSRAVVVACRDKATALSRFGDADKLGVVLSKSGRTFFSDPEEEEHIVEAVRSAMEASGLWDELATGFVVLDGEMLPWNAKAGGLIRETFAAAGAAGRAASAAACTVFAQAAARDIEGAHGLAWRATERGAAMDAYRKAYGAFVLPFQGKDDLKFAPFHVLAAEGQVFTDASHCWHMEIAKRLASPDGPLIATRWMSIDPSLPEDCAKAIQWWDDITAAGQEGFIVKGASLRPSAQGAATAIKVRGREYLRIVYGPEYDRPETLPGLKKRATGRKRTLARIGTSLGLETLSLLVEGAPLAKIHELAWASLAVGLEPLDVRL